jgi:hypothetical protein
MSVTLDAQSLNLIYLNIDKIAGMKSNTLTVRKRYDYILVKYKYFLPLALSVDLF